MQDACGFNSVVVFAIPKVPGMKPRHIAVVIVIRRCWDIDDGAAAIMTAHLGLAHTAAATKGEGRVTVVSADAAGRATAG
jgi:hypothetical protein